MVKGDNCSLKKWKFVCGNNQSSNIYIVSIIGILCNKIYIIRWRLALMVEETGVPRDNK